MKILFACVENSCRSQMAEALGNHMFPEETFMSAGTHPASTVDQGAIKVLEEEGINWDGKPKSLDQVEQPDMLVMMGCDVVCPYLPGVKTVAWEIPDPKGKSVKEYRRIVHLLKKKIKKLISDHKNS